MRKRPAPNELGAGLFYGFIRFFVNSVEQLLKKVNLIEPVAGKCNSPLIFTFHSVNKTFCMKKLYLMLAAIIAATITNAQIDIHQLMERRDLKLSQIDSIAKQHFAAVGTGKGTGYNQYQRWLYEQRFHLNEQGFLRPQAEETAAFEQALQVMRTPSVAGTWVATGPSSWNRTSGWNPGVGRITCIGISPFDTTVIYVGSPGGGLWKSVNSGTSWIPLSDNASSRMNVTAVAVDPLNVNVVYVAATGGNFKSTDGGATWTLLPTVGGTVRKFLIEPGNSNDVFAASTSGIYRSTNAGASWTLVNNISTEDIEFRPSEVNTMYATGSSSSGHFRRSSDNGVTWTVMGAAAGITNSGRTLVAVTPADPNVVYVVQANGSTFGRMYRSNDGGTTFTTTIVGTVSGSPAVGTNNFFGYNTDGSGATGQATYDMAMCASPFNANEVHIAGIIVFVSYNGGTSFTAETAWSLPNGIGYNHADVHTLDWINNTIYSSSDGGIYKSLDRGDNWLDLSTGLDIRQFYRIDCSQTDPAAYGGGAQDNGSSIHKSTGWIDWLGADGMEMEFSYTNANVVYGTSQNGQLYRSTNGGSSYSSLPQSASGNWVTPFAVRHSKDSVVYVGWTGVYMTRNRGNSWTKLSGTTIASALDCLTLSASDTNYIYTSAGATLYRSFDGGTNWTAIAAPSTISSIEVHPRIPTKIWITTTGGSRVYVSTDGGTSFTAIAGSLPAVSARSIVMDKDDLNEGLYVGMNTGVYYKDNTMPDWVPFLTGLPLVAVNELDIQQSARKIRVGTYGRGVWETDLNTNNPIPVRWISFSGKRTNSGNQLTWKAAEDANTDSYELEYSPNGVQYNTVKTIVAQSKLQNSSGLTATYTEAHPEKNDAYYRLKQFDKNGRFSYSEVVFIKGGQSKQLVLYPNPVKDQLRLSIPGVLGNDQAIVQIYHVNGIKLLEQRVPTNTATINTARFSPGQYIVRVTAAGNVYQQVFSKAE